MIDAIPELIKIFAAGGIELLPESAEDSDAHFPCVTYSELENTDDRLGDSMGYSSIAFSFEVWSYSFSELTDMAMRIDGIMKKCRFERFMSEVQTVDGLHRKILRYRKILKESYSN